MLEKIAWVLLSLERAIDSKRRRLTARDIDLAIDRRTKFKRGPTALNEGPSSRQLFRHFAIAWARSMGRFEEATKKCRFAEYLAAFEDHMLSERGLSPVTIATCRERLTWLFDDLPSRRRSLQDIRITDIDDFIVKEHDKGWTRRSLGALAGSLRCFFRYAEIQGWCATGLSAGIEGPRLYEREGIPEGPPWRDVQRLLESTRGDRPVDIRDHAILLLLALYGLRRGEVAHLRLDDIDWEGEAICVSRPKQRCIQRYPLLPVAGDAIRYLREARPRTAHRQLFMALHGPIRSLSAMSISAVAASRLAAIGVALRPHGAHCLRHACAAHLLASGFSLKQIGDHLGHRAVNSTLSYTKVDLKGLRQVAEIDLGRIL